MQQPKKGQLTSYLSVRLDGAEIEALRVAAARRGMRPSPLARHFILWGLKAQAQASNLNERVQSLERGFDKLEKALSQRGKG